MNRVIIRAKDGNLTVGNQRLEQGHGMEVELEPGASLTLRDADTPPVFPPSGYDAEEDCLLFKGRTYRGFDLSGLVVGQAYRVRIDERLDVRFDHVSAELPADEQYNGATDAAGYGLHATVSLTADPVDAQADAEAQAAGAGQIAHG